MKSSMIGVFTGVLFLITVSGARASVPLPEQPSGASHPGSAVYSFDSTEQTVQLEAGSVTLFLPKTALRSRRHRLEERRLPVVVFGHGHMAPLFTYRTMFEHLARKGIAVIFPEYDSSSRSDFDVMAETWVALVRQTLDKFSNLDPQKIVYSGHSNGALVAFKAAGRTDDPLLIKPHAIVLFDTAGRDDAALARIDSRTMVTLVVGDQDTKTPPDSSKRKYDALRVDRKQLIVMRSYTETSPEVIADHGWVRTYDWGGARVTPLHYFGSWKFLVGAVWDLEADGRGTNSFIYGDEAASTGLPDARHEVLRNF